MFATGVISGIAAWVSYWHMVGVAARYGETSTSSYLLPVSVDGLIVVASISLVELAAQIRRHEHHDQQPARVEPRPRPAPVPTIVPTVPAAEDVDLDEDQAVTPDLLDHARQLVAEHRRRTGRDLTRDQLRARLRVSNATAGELLHRVRTEIRPPSRTTVQIGVPTR